MGSAKPPRILIAEDEPLVRMMLVEALQEAGYLVSEAEDAHSALSILERCDQIMLLLSDVRMPGTMDGVDLAQWVREHRASVKVMLMSGYVSNAHQRLQATTFDAFISKPFKIGDVVSKAAQLTGSC